MGESLGRREGVGAGGQVLRKRKVVPPFAARLGQHRAHVVMSVQTGRSRRFLAAETDHRRAADVMFSKQVAKSPRTRRLLETGEVT